MFSQIAQNFCHLKRTFYHEYDGGSHIQEIIPQQDWGGLNRKHIGILHKLCNSNPIYHDTYTQSISGVHCTVYEGDINQYWLDSIKNPGSTQPFYPTWVLSAYILVLRLQQMGYSQVIDIGSGDGRISFCAKILNMNACSIDVDPNLVELQRILADHMGVSLDIRCTDAAHFDYASLGYDNPVLFTGGLPQMGDVLAMDILRILSRSHVKYGIILAGSHPRKMMDTTDSLYGWGPIIDKFHLRVQWTMDLPTVWTFDQNFETPYMCVTM